MKINGWQKLATATALFPLAAIAFATPAVAATTTVSPNNFFPASAEVTLSQQGNYPLTQVSDSCRQVVSRYGLYVRREPTAYSQILGVIDYRRNVTIKNRGVNGWVPISAPLEGYVYAGFLGFCEETSSPPENCRRVVAYGGLNVRREPSIYATIVGIVSNGRRVTIENRGTNGWVPITVPLVGYVSSNYLVYCQ